MRGCVEWVETKAVWKAAWWVDGWVVLMAGGRVVGLVDRRGCERWWGRGCGRGVG